MTKFNQLLQRSTTEFTPVILTEHFQDSYVKIDLSIEQNLKLDIDPVKQTQAFINQFLTKTNKSIAYGGYLEQRNLYQRSAHFTDDARDVHIGLDIWCSEYTPVVAPLDAVVHSFKDNDSLGNYGPTVLLKHEINSTAFYTLYGHLSRESLKQLELGQVILKNESFAEIGLPEENGVYAPHLHFQIIRDLEDYQGDYPGVAKRSKIDYYSKNCPDPNLLLKIY